jgi:predicted HicB family RNase H-like nuclease
MARPKKESDEARSKLMQVRLQVKEYREFKDAAEAAGMELSVWVRAKLRDAARRDVRKYG